MNELHRELLTGGAPGFEAGVLRETISAARRTRRIRSATRYGSGALAVIAAALLWFPRTTNHPPSSQAAVESAAMPPVQNRSSFVTIHTTPFAGVIRTQPLAQSRQVASASARIQVIRTAETHPKIEMINDEQLLSLFEGQAVALIGSGPNSRLVFPESTGTE